MLKDLDVNTVMLLIIALANFGGLVIGIISRKDIKQLETNTNSIKDALVKSTADASFAAGGKEAREKGEAEAKILLAARPTSQQAQALAPTAPTEPSVPVDIKQSVPIEMKVVK